MTIDVSYDSTGHIVPEHFRQLLGVRNAVRMGVDPATLADDPDYTASEAVLHVPDIIPTGYTDIAAGKPVKYIGEGDIGSQVSAVTDGNSDTFWFCDAPRGGDRLEIDLGALYPISAVRVKTRGANNMERRNFTLTASESIDFAESGLPARAGSVSAPQGRILGRGFWINRSL